MNLLPLTVFAVASPYAWDVVDAALGRFDVRCLDNLGGADDRLPGLHTEPTAAELDAAFTLGLSSATARAAGAHAAHALGFTQPVALVHSFSNVASTSVVKHGAFVGAGVVVGSNAVIGCHANINRSASIGHDNVIAFAASIGPGAVLAGHVTVEAGAFVGAGAVVLPGRRIGRGATVGAGAVVTSDVEAGSTVVGTPARVLVAAPSIQQEDLTCPHC